MSNFFVLKKTVIYGVLTRIRRKLDENLIYALLWIIFVKKIAASGQKIFSDSLVFSAFVLVAIWMGANRHI